MRRFSVAEKRAYVQSNDVTSAPFAVDPAARAWAVEIEVAIAREDKDALRGSCQALLDALCDAASVPRATFKLKDTAYAKFRGGRAVWKLYGTYTCDGPAPRSGTVGPREGGAIMVAYRTAVRRQVFAYRTFLDTLVHEFMHHYDAHGLRLAASFHTSGFYQRVRSIVGQLAE